MNSAPLGQDCPRVGRKVKLAASVAACLAIAGAAFLLSAIHKIREDLRLKSSAESIRRDFRDLTWKYVNRHGYFPRSATYDKDGRPLMSWRAEIVRGIGGAYLWCLNLNESWNTPSNINCLQNTNVGICFRRDSGEPPTETSKVAVVGPDTMISADRYVTPDECTDGLANTIVVVELAGFKPFWTRPADITIEEFVAAVQRGPEESGLRRFYHAGVNCLFADGSVRLIAGNTKPDTLRALCTRSGGETIANESLARKWFDLLPATGPPIDTPIDYAAILAQPEIVRQRASAEQNYPSDVWATKVRENLSRLERVHAIVDTVWQAQIEQKIARMSARALWESVVTKNFRRRLPPGEVTDGIALLSNRTIVSALEEKPRDEVALLPTLADESNLADEVDLGHDYRRSNEQVKKGELFAEIIRTIILNAPHNLGDASEFQRKISQ